MAPHGSKTPKHISQEVKWVSNEVPRSKTCLGVKSILINNYQGLFTPHLEYQVLVDIYRLNP